MEEGCKAGAEAEAEGLVVDGRRIERLDGRLTEGVEGWERGGG